MELFEANIGLQYLRKMAESVLFIPIATLPVERSFSAMNRIMSKLRNQMGQDALKYCMKISIEGEEDTPQKFIEEQFIYMEAKKLVAFDKFKK